MNHARHVKFTDTQVVFRELPDEITLAINISGCPCDCVGCHSQYLRDDIGEELTNGRLDELIEDNDGITAVSFMGGDGNPKAINRLARHVRKSWPMLAVGWYSGRQEISGKIDCENFHYIKVGPYVQSRGALDTPDTNQRMYRVDRGDYGGYELTDITSFFWASRLYQDE